VTVGGVDSVLCELGIWKNKIDKKRGGRKEIGRGRGIGFKPQSKRGLCLVEEKWVYVQTTTKGGRVREVRAEMETPCWRISDKKNKSLKSFVPGGEVRRRTA